MAFNSNVDSRSNAASLPHRASQTNIELQPMQIPHLHTQNQHQTPLSPKNTNNDPAESLPQPSTAVGVTQRWNHPRANICRTFATFFAFIIMGANDAAYGALIPYIEEYYHLTYVVVSMVFLSPLVGYAGAAFLNNFIHIRVGQRGIAFIGPICHFFAYLGIALHPPYPVLVAIFILAGFGNGLEDAAWNAYVGNFANSNEVLGFLHGFYGLGAVFSPLAATTLITKSGWPWYAFYYLMLGGAAMELGTSVWAFWGQSGTVYRESNPRTTAAKESRLTESLRSRVTWVASLFLLCYVGVEVALGGWIVTFMRQERAGKPFESGLVATGFWTGITVGRFILGFVTPRLGEKFAVALYLLASMVCQLIFWLVPQFHISAVAVSLQGFFLGPLFPATVVAATKALPVYLHVSAIGFAAAFGGGGAAVLPFGIGALAQAQGVSILQPVILAMLVILLTLWLCLPKVNKDTGTTHGASDPSPSGKRWINIDFDLVEAGRRTIKKARGGAAGPDGVFSQPPRSLRAGIRQRVDGRRETRSDRRWANDQIRQLHTERETPAFAVLQGVDPASDRPPPYHNVRIRTEYGGTA